MPLPGHVLGFIFSYTCNKMLRKLRNSASSIENVSQIIVKLAMCLDLSQVELQKVSKKIVCLAMLVDLRTPNEFLGGHARFHFRSLVVKNSGINGLN